MTERTSVGIDKKLRKKIKQLAFWLEISQGEVIKRAIQEYEKQLVSDKNRSENIKNVKADLDKLYEKATESVWAEDPKTKEIQQKLLESPESIDDFIANNWDSGL